MAGLWRTGIDSGTFDCHYAAMPDDDRYSLTELADLAGVTPRTVRYYLAQWPPAGGRPDRPRQQVHARPPRAAAADPAAPGRASAAGRDPAPARGAGRRGDPRPRRGERTARRRPTPRSSTCGPCSADRSPIEPAHRATGSQPTVPPPPPGRRACRAAPDAARGRAGQHGRSPRQPVESYQPSPAPAPADATARPSDRSQWERIVLAPDVELHIRRPLARAQNKQVDRLVTIARELLEEDRP